MLIINLIGGLGNQMFQYAFGCSLSVQLNVPVKFDVHNLLQRTSNANFTYRDFELDIFKGKVEIATNGETAIHYPQPNKHVARAIHRFKRRILAVNYYQEKEHTIFDPEVLLTSKNTYFEGYWQNEKYFLYNESMIRQKFQFKKPLSDINAILAAQISATDSIGIHVRRGDYVTNAQANDFHGVCSISYYQQAVALVKKYVSNGHLYVFSDEPDWVMNNLTFDIPTTYVSHNKGKESYEDMRLMSLCQHNIIANSSFSWWGAWLNNNINKIVISPKQWAQENRMNSEDIIPSKWIKI